MKKGDFKLLKRQNEFLYELKNLLWLNFCNEDFEAISKDSKNYQLELDKIKSKPFEINEPSDGSVIGTPTPKKLSVASIEIE